jgi:predicted component of type VI protein secretion system
VIQLQSLSGRTAGQQYLARRFPVQIGRASDCHVQVEEAGVWDRHAAIVLQPDGTFVLRVNSPALASINSEPIQGESGSAPGILHNGDVIELGSAKIRFSLSPTRHRDFRLRELLAWLAFAALCLGQVAFIYLLERF